MLTFARESHRYLKFVHCHWFPSNSPTEYQKFSKSVKFISINPSNFPIFFSSFYQNDTLKNVKNLTKGRKRIPSNNMMGRESCWKKLEVASTQSTSLSPVVRFWLDMAAWIVGLVGRRSLTCAGGDVANPNPADPVGTRSSISWILGISFSLRWIFQKIF